MTNDKPRPDPLTEAAFAKRLGLAILSVLQHKGVVTDLDVETILAVAQQAVRDSAVREQAAREPVPAPNGGAREEQSGKAEATQPEASRGDSPSDGVPHIDMEL